MRVGEVMSRNVVSVPVDATLVEAAELMRNHSIGFLPVIASGIVVGVITDRDIVVRGLGEGGSLHHSISIHDVDQPVCCYEDDVLTDAATYSQHTAFTGWLWLTITTNSPVCFRSMTWLRI